MAHILFMFLGAGKLQRTNYSFPSGSVYSNRNLFGLALLEEQAKIRPVDKLVVMGTSGSGWELLVSETAGDQDGLAGLRERKTSPKSGGGIDTEALSPFQAAVAQVLRSKGLALETIFELVGLAFDKAEQIQLIDTVAQHVNPGDSISFDVTNGFRHFPLIGVMAAIVVKRLREAKLAGIWYGGFEHPLNSLDRGDERVAPAVRLDGLAELADWIEALSAFNADGNFGRFAALLQAGGISSATAESLRAAGFREQTGELRGAANELTNFRHDARNEMPAGGAKLFLPALFDRTAWAEGNDQYSHYRSLAKASAKSQDLARIARLAYEAALTRIAIHFGQGDILEYEVRKRAAEEFETQANKANVKAYRELRNIRHILSHGGDLVTVIPEVRKVLADAEKCRTFLIQRMNTLLPPDPMQPL